MLTSPLPAVQGFVCMCMYIYTHNCIYSFILGCAGPLLLHWLSLVAVHRQSLQWLLLLWSMGSRVCGLQQLWLLGSRAQAQ